MLKNIDPRHFIDTHNYKFSDNGVLFNMLSISLLFLIGHVSQSYIKHKVQYVIDNRTYFYCLTFSWIQIIT